MTLGLPTRLTVTRALAPGEEPVTQPSTPDSSRTSVNNGVVYEVQNHQEIPPTTVLVALSPEENAARWQRIRETHKVSEGALHPHH